MFKKLLLFLTLMLSMYGQAYGDNVTWEFRWWGGSLGNQGYYSYQQVMANNSVAWTITHDGLQLENPSNARYYVRDEGSGYIQLLGTTIKVPVTMGQLVTFYLQSMDSHQAIYTVGGSTEGGNVGLIYQTETAKTYRANSNGYITITSTSNYCRINHITREDAPPVFFDKTECEAELIDMNFQEPKLYYPDGATVNYSVSNPALVTLGGEQGYGDLTLLNTGICTITATVNYNGQTYTASYTLTIKADDATYEIEGDTYTLTGTGKLQDRVVTGVPKIQMEFGENLNNVVNITMVRSLQGISDPVATSIDVNGWRHIWMNTVDGKLQPYQGTYYTFKPESNGHLTVRGYLNRGTAYLVDAENLAPAPNDVTGKVWIGTGNWSWYPNNGNPGDGVVPEITTSDGRQTKLVERYEDKIETTGDIMSQTLSDLENGTYDVYFYANACYTPGRGIPRGENDMYAFNDGATDIAYVFANGVTTPIQALNATSISENGYYHVQTQVTDGTLKMGLGKWKPGTNWHTIQIHKLVKMGSGDTPFTPIAKITSNSETEKEETTVELIGGHTYYLYGNTPSTYDGNDWATYQLYSFTFSSDFRYAQKSIVLDRDATSGGQQIISSSSNIEYSYVTKGDITSCTLNSDGTVSNIVGEGGAIIVTASLKNGGNVIDTDYYVITVPYKNKVWDFHTVVPSDIPAELDWGVNYEVRQYDDETRALYYLNEPILVADQSLEGNNAYWIGETAGLVVESKSKSFGLRTTAKMNLGEVADYNAYFGTNYTAAEFEELQQDGAFVDNYLRIMRDYTKNDVQSTNIPAMDSGALLTFPKLRKGTYVGIQSYRHSPNTGDYIKATNVTDLDGKARDNNEMRFMVLNQSGDVTTDVYPNTNGWIVFKVANDGDVTFRVNDKGWNHIKRLMVAEKFYDIDEFEGEKGEKTFDSNLILARQFEDSEIWQPGEEKDDKHVGQVKNGSSEDPNNLSPTVFDADYSKGDFTYKFYNHYYGRITRQEAWHTMKFFIEDIKGFGDYSYEEENASSGANASGMANHVKRANTNPTVSITEDGLLTATAGHGSVVVVQKVYARNDTLWAEPSNSDYVVDIHRTRIYIREKGNTTQTYPYTWDFTNIPNFSESENWSDPDNDGTFNPTDKGKNAYVQNSELETTSGDDIDELDGLGFVTSVDENGISADGLDNVGIKTGGEGDKGVVIGKDEETTIVVPEVPEGATVYIRLTPNSDDSTVKGGTGDAMSDSGSEGGYTPSTLTPTNENLDNTGQNTYEIPGDGGDVNITVKDVTIEGIAVTNIVKECKFWDKINGEKEDGSTISGYEGFYCYNSDSHNLAINYPLTKYYTGTFMNAMYVTGTSKSDGKVFATTVPINITPSTTTLSENGITLSEKEGFGVLVYSVDYDVNHPLFVPAIHDNPDVSTNANNMLIGIYEAKSLPASSESEYLYVFTNLYTQKGASSKTTSDIPGFFKVESSGTLKANRAYLPLAADDAPLANTIFITPYEGYYDSIEDVKGAEVDAEATFHTITGVEIQGKPSQRGVYIQNGKKVLVK